MRDNACLLLSVREMKKTSPLEITSLSATEISRAERIDKCMGVRGGAWGTGVEKNTYFKILFRYYFPIKYFNLFFFFSYSITYAQTKI